MEVLLCAFVLCVISESELELKVSCMLLRPVKYGQMFLLLFAVLSLLFFSKYRFDYDVMVRSCNFRFGASLTAVSDPAHPHHPLHDVQMKKGERRRETNSLLSVARHWNPDPKRKR